jgi:hypothetical protein
MEEKRLDTRKIMNYFLRKKKCFSLAVFILPLAIAVHTLTTWRGVVHTNYQLLS